MKGKVMNNGFLKTVLFFIMFFLGAIAYQSFNKPAMADSPLANDPILMSSTVSNDRINLVFLDKRTGNIWVYKIDRSSSRVKYFGRLIKLGEEIDFSKNK
ncbi:MAG TPA: hypothetical protein ENK44_09105 [Caldithrix abyssi]|uniref:Uncharacterized protein n=1 Tax=Caldithrix abyssi TaxID=187145 RepID=A0A7V4WVS7_CALAY|nr:hypothetical protein [Caldithrix abyssi]